MVTQQIYGAYRMDVEVGGYVHFDVQLTNSPHRHDYFEICLVLGGSGVYYHGGQTFEVDQGTLFLAEPGVVHEITSFDSRDLQLFFVSMTLSSLGNEPREFEDQIIHAFQTHRTIISGGHGSLQNYLPLLDAASGHPSFAGKNALAMFALEMMNSLCAEPIEALSKDEGDDIARALAFIGKNMATKFTVEDIATEVGVSERTLRRRFKERSGTTISEEMNHRKMRYAAHRLLMGFGVAEVAEYVGISHSGQFTRAFKRAFGMGPKQFQSSYMPGTLAHKTRPCETN